MPFRYREYREEPLDEGELREILGRLGVGPRELLRPKEAKAQGIDGALSDDELIGRMAAHPTLVQRPIALLGDRALLARPETLLPEFLSGS